MAINQTNCGLKAKEPGTDYFVFFSLANLVRWLQHNVHGMVLDTITTPTLEETSSFRPPLRLMRRFGETVAPMVGRNLAGLRQARRLTALHDALLPKLISGELRVPDAERIVRRCV